MRYQAEPIFRAPLADAFADRLRSAAMIDPEQRFLVLARVRDTDRDPDMMARAKRLGMVRAIETNDGRVAFTGEDAIHDWAIDGYKLALQRLGPEHAWRLDDMDAWELDWVVVRFQMEHAPDVMRRTVGADKLDIRHTVARSRSVSPKEGYPRKRFVVPLNPGPDVKIVGAPDDRRFRLRPDMVRFLDHALGGFEHYHWQLNPRRRRRVRGKGAQHGRRYFMNANHGISITTGHRILRAIAAWAPRVDPERNWADLFARPVYIIDLPDHARYVRYAMHQLARRLLREAGLLPKSARADLPASVGHKLFTEISTTPETPSRRRTDPSAASSAPSRHASSSSSSFAAPGAAACAGYLVDTDHANFFHARLVEIPDDGDGSGTGARVAITVMDPHGKITVDQETVAARMTHELRAAIDDILGRGASVVRVTFAAVPKALALQYAFEGSCGPSSIALLFSLLRHMRQQPRRLDPEAVFRGVTDEDVVVAVQLVHSAVV